MLRNLHIKNLALIREVDVDFADGLNILTGETGAGKSIIIDSIGLALGGKVQRNLVRSDDAPALVELVFEETNEDTLGSLREMGIDTEDGVVFISRKIRDGRSQLRINGETVTAQEVRRASSLLIDIHGQSEHQKLLRGEHQLSLIDECGKERIAPVRAKVAECYQRYAEIRTKLGAEEVTEEERARQISFLTFEIDEIDHAELEIGEDELLEKSYRRMTNAKRIVEAASGAHALTGYEEGAGESIGRAMRLLASVGSYDEELEEISASLTEVDDLLNDFNRSLSDYLDSLSFEEEEFRKTEDRLNVINRLKSRFGDSIEKILAYRDARMDELAELRNYEESREELKKQETVIRSELENLCGELTGLRAEYGEKFAGEVRRQLADLNFARADFAVEFTETPDFGVHGKDAVSFVISTNPGSPRLPLNKVVSGGELSRIMLGIKTMFADTDTTDTLIFDEIDTGISGRTAQKVAEKMAAIARHHQVLCITHLPQIAAMADTHYAITKDVSEESAITNIDPLSEEEAVMEIARILGGAEITEITRNSAAEMREMCRQYKADVL